MVQRIPLVSVIIVNHNGINFIDTCLRSVLDSNYPNFEVILVDNGSSDGSLAYVKKAFGSDARLKFVENRGSLGPAVGRNRGARASAGEYLVFLDNDTQTAVNWIQELVKVLENDRSIGAAQAKLLRMATKKYDCAGDYLGPLGFLIERSRGAEDIGQFDSIADILSAKSAASVIRKDLFEKIGGFDEDYYMYLEETDLSWRVWLSGKRVVFIPGAVVYHAFNTPRKDFKRYYRKDIVRYYGCRNYISTLVKNLQIRNILAILPLHIGVWQMMAILFFLKGEFLDSFYILKGIFWNILNIRALIHKYKRNNQKIRRVDDNIIFSRVKSQENLGELFRKTGIYLKTSL